MPGLARPHRSCHRAGAACVLADGRSDRMGVGGHQSCYRLPRVRIAHAVIREHCSRRRRVQPSPSAGCAVTSADPGQPLGMQGLHRLASSFLRRRERPRTITMRHSRTRTSRWNRSGQVDGLLLVDARPGQQDRPQYRTCSGESSSGLFRWNLAGLVGAQHERPGRSALCRFHRESERSRLPVWVVQHVSEVVDKATLQRSVLPVVAADRLMYIVS